MTAWVWMGRSSMRTASTSPSPTSVDLYHLKLRNIRREKDRRGLWIQSRRENASVPPGSLDAFFFYIHLLYQALILPSPPSPPKKSTSHQITHPLLLPSQTSF
jgi:hypothetical protein